MTSGSGSTSADRSTAGPSDSVATSALPAAARGDDVVPALTACSLCAGETLGEPPDAPGGQLERLRAIESRGVARLALVECLDECERGDVVVARPSRRGRESDGRPVWFERLAGEELTAALADWLVRGGPGRAPVPDRLTGCVLRRRD